MIGNLILWIKKKINQEIICIHDYKPDRIGIITGMSHYTYQCSKCGKYKR